CWRHLYLNAVASVMKKASPRRYSNQVGTACGAPSGAVTATTATFGSARNCAISRLVMGIVFYPPASTLQLSSLSAALEFRFALFEKGFDRLLVVLGESGKRLAQRLTFQHAACVGIKRRVKVGFHV